MAAEMGINIKWIHKYEFWSMVMTFLLVDEIHTPDSSEYLFYAEAMRENQKNE